jgi:uncharacterized protein YbjT (DUF2867 family)
MSTVQEIEAAIRELSPSELAELRAWFNQGMIPLSGEASQASHVPKMPFPPPVVQPAAIRDPIERRKAFAEWVASHSDITAVADDSRESIYEGCGE